MIEKSKRYTDTLWCICDNYEEYRHFVKQMWQWNKKDGIFAGQNFEYDDHWFESTGNWMDTFGIPCVKEDPDDEYSDEYEIKNPLVDEYEIEEKPENDEYPVIVHVEKLMGKVEVDWFSIPKASKKYRKEYSESTLMGSNKKWLVEYINCLVHNNRILYARIDRQSSYLEELNEDIKSEKCRNLEHIKYIQMLENRIEEIKYALWNQRFSDEECIKQIQKIVGIYHGE